MVKDIIKDTVFLKQKSSKATKFDLNVVTDLNDTLNAHKENCVGMAANMIGVKKNIIIVSLGMTNLIMLNPKILKKGKPYETSEGCLSLNGMRKTKRYENILVEYEDSSFVKHTASFSGHIAQIIQHEIDHCNGIII